jgi:hypothetical protein
MELAQKLPKQLLPLVWFLFLKSRCEQPTPGPDIPSPVGKFMFSLVQQAQSKSTAVHLIAAARFVLLLMVLICCSREKSLGDDKTARQRFVVEVSGVIRMNSVPATGTTEISRVEISSAGEVVLALSSTEEPASSSDAVFLLHSGQSCHLSFRRRAGPLKGQTVSLSGQPCLELADESTPVMTITSI